MKININTKQGKGSRSVQQDTYGISRKYVGPEKGILAVLSDGMGGMQAGETFSRIAAEEMVNAFELDDSGEDMTVRLQNAYRAARNKALEAAEKPVFFPGRKRCAILLPPSVTVVFCGTNCSGRIFIKPRSACGCARKFLSAKIC